MKRAGFVWGLVLIGIVSACSADDAPTDQITRIDGPAVVDSQPGGADGQRDD